MRLLLDTHVLLWWLANDDRLSAEASSLIEARNNHVFVSPISLWEIAIKSQIGKLRADVEEVRQATFTGGIRELPFGLTHACEIAKLPLHHRDPFDRALIAQATVESLTLLSHDSNLKAYGERVLVV